MRKILFGNIFSFDAENKHDHSACLLKFPAENQFHLKKLHVQSILDLFRVFQADKQHALLFFFEWHHLCKVFSEVRIALFLFFWSVSLQEIVRSPFAWQYFWGHMCPGMVFLGANHFLYGFFILRTCCCLQTSRTFLPFHGSKCFFISRFNEIFTRSSCGLSIHILCAVYPFSW